jgi:hypothetical protein
VLRSGDSPTRFKEHAHRRLAAGGRSRCVQAVGATRLPRPLPRAVGKRRGFLHGYCSTIRRAGQIDMPHLGRRGRSTQVTPASGENRVRANSLATLAAWQSLVPPRYPVSDPRHETAPTITGRGGRAGSAHQERCVRVRFSVAAEKAGAARSAPKTMRVASAVAPSQGPRSAITSSMKSSVSGMSTL